MTDAFVYTAVRTPFGRYNGALSAIRPDDLAAHIITAMLARTPGFDPARIGDIIFGNATAPARRTATSPGWRACSPGCRSRCRGG